MLKDRGPFPIAQEHERTLDRRRFLRGAAAVAVAVGCGKAIAHVLPQSRSFPAVDPAKFDDLGVRQARTIQIDGSEVVAVRLSADRIVAYDRKCPHLGCPVVWSAERTRFECPCHHAAFDAATGEVLFGPPRRGLSRVTVKA